MNSRHISRVLAAFMLASCTLTSCGGAALSPSGTDNTDSSATTAEPVETELTDGLPDVDMNGFEFSVVHYDGVWLSWAECQLEAESENGDLLNDAIYRRNRSIEERFNCVLDIQERNKIESIDISTAVLSGDTTYDMWFCYDLWTLGCAEYLMAWNDMPYVNLEAEWWNPMATEVFKIGGKQIATSGNYSLSTLSRAAGFMFNKELFEKLSFDESIYDLASEGKWTIDKFYGFCKAAASDLNGDTVMDTNDRYGCAGSWKELYNRLVLGSGVSYVTPDADGFPTLSLATDEAAIDKVLYIFNKFSDKDVYNNGSSASMENGAYGEFKEGKSLFDMGNMLKLELNRDLEIDIGFVPCPKYDEAQEHYYAPAFGTEISVLPKTLAEDRMDNVGIILEALAFDTNKEVIPQYKEVLLKTKYARDNESEAMIDIVIDSVSFEFGLNAWQDSVANPFVRGVFASGTGNVASTLASIKSTVDTQVKQLREKLGQ